MSAAVTGVRDHTPVPLSRIAWLTTVGICLVASVLLLLSGLLRLRGRAVAVGLSAAINLR